MSASDHFRHANRALVLLFVVVALWVIFGESSLPGAQ